MISTVMIFSGDGDNVDVLGNRGVWGSHLGSESLLRRHAKSRRRIACISESFYDACFDEDIFVSVGTWVFFKGFLRFEGSEGVGCVLGVL